MGRIVKHHRFMLQLHLRQIDAIDAATVSLDEEVEATLAPFREGVELLKTIPGVNDISAEGILAEKGKTDRRSPDLLSGDLSAIL